MISKITQNALMKLVLMPRKEKIKLFFQDMLNREFNRDRHQVGIKPHEHQQHFDADTDTQRNRHRDRQSLIRNIPQQRNPNNTAGDDIQYSQHKSLLEIGFKGVKEVRHHKDRFFIGKVAQDVHQSAGCRSNRDHRDTAEQVQKIKLYQFPEFASEQFEEIEKPFFLRSVLIDAGAGFAVVKQSTK